MQHISTKPASVSTFSILNGSKQHEANTDECEEIQGFTYNALAVLGPNYLTRKWLPKKGPYFYAFVQCMRAHVFWDFETHEQKNKVFFEADTIAQMCGMSRATVFRLLNDPDMELFVKRVPWRRWDKALHKELQTSNRYMVAMDDPPIDEADRVKVRQAQAQLEAMQRGETLIEDDDRPMRRSRSTPRKSSESHSETLIGVALRDSDSSLTERHEDRILTNLSDGGFTSICTKGDVGASAIGNDRIVQQVTPERRTTTAKETNRDAQQSNRIASVDSAAPRRPEREEANALIGAAILTESEAWRVDARVVAASAICRHVEHFQGTDPESALEKILSAHAPYLTPPATLEKLAEIARNRTDNRYAHIDETATGYYISTLANLAGEARKCGYDLTKLAKKASKAQRKTEAEAHASPTQQAYTPRQQAHRTGNATRDMGSGDDYYRRLNASLYER